MSDMQENKTVEMEAAATQTMPTLPPDPEAILEIRNLKKSCQRMQTFLHICNTDFLYVSKLCNSNFRSNSSYNNQQNSYRSYSRRS